MGAVTVIPPTSLPQSHLSLAMVCHLASSCYAAWVNFISMLCAAQISLASGYLCKIHFIGFIGLNQKSQLIVT